ncbi:hypothetical protein [Thalassospira lohafexi]|uniref:Uncharacterized protein n=1 Tax=Thalassospira lohafexi TaxID=744227 RepID=A0A2N3LC47_9PROT|nr:hypothetical protein [Thalassospira lohafexi]PKR60433.1 hypothetical protein COO92_03605 [Thalassospira lohafexi]
MFRLIKVSVLSIALLTVALAGSIALTVLTYTRLTDEKPIASLYFEPVAEEEFIAHLSSPHADVDGTYKLYGDQWRIDAAFMKLQPWANILGMDARYKLVRFEGRYSDIERENTQPHIAYELGSDGGFDLGYLLVKLPFLMDAQYGSSTFTDISEDAVYTVYRTQFGLLVRSEPKPEPIGEKASVLGQVRSWIGGD